MGARRQLAIYVSAWLAAFLAPVQAEDLGREMRVGVLRHLPPHYVTQKEFGEPAGFAIDVMDEVARRARIKIRYEAFRTWPDLLAAAKGGKIDLVPVLPVDDEMGAAFDFTLPVHRSPINVFVRKDNTVIRSIQDLQGRRVSVVKSDVGERLMRIYRGELSIVHANVVDALNAVLTRTSDALVFQNEVVTQHARSLGIASLLKAIDPPLYELDLAIAVRKDQPELLIALDQVLNDYLRSTAYFEARDAWGGNPAPVVNARTVVLVMGALLALSVAALGAWRHVSVLRLNTALAKSIAERRAAEERFRDHAEAASDWFFEQDKDLRFTFLSPRFEAVTGLDPAKLIGRTRMSTVALLGLAEEAEQWREHEQIEKAHRDWRDFTYTLKTDAGERRIITTSGKAVYDGEGKFLGYRGVGRDVTNRIAMEQALSQAHKMETVGQLTGGIAHDFNNLLTVLTGNLELIRRRLKGDRQAGIYVGTASEAVELGAQLTQRLLAFSRRQPLDPKVIDLKELVSDMKSLLLSSLGAAIELNVDVGAGPHTVMADEPQLQNALLNLAINARDAMPDGGDLTIETRLAVIDEVFVRMHPGACIGRFMVLRVKDTGTGIAPENLDKVIEPFFTTKEVGKGSGLGLSMVYGFAKQSGGFLLVDSEAGAGTTASIYLPATEEECRRERIVKTGEDVPAANGEAVLVVEDNPGVMLVAVARLEHLGYSVLQAENGYDALTLIDENPSIALLFTDVVMPGGMSGIDLAREARKRRSDLKVLYATGYADQAAKHAEKENWLFKPYKQTELARKVRHVLDA